jgi:hypothetical protein
MAKPGEVLARQSVRRRSPAAPVRDSRTLLSSRWTRCSERRHFSRTRAGRIPTLRLRAPNDRRSFHAMGFALSSRRSWHAACFVCREVYRSFAKRSHMMTTRNRPPWAAAPALVAASALTAVLSCTHVDDDRQGVGPPGQGGSAETCGPSSSAAGRFPAQTDCDSGQCVQSCSAVNAWWDATCAGGHCRQSCGKDVL